ncbi:D-alanine--D-alanine ligase [Candidatus Omnitrophota bacterium]
MSKTSDKHLGRVGVIMGGVSSERDISLKSGKAVCEALKEKCDVVPLDLTTEAKEEVISFIKASKISVAFVALHGHFGEDGGIQEILEEMHIPYPGSGVLASMSAIDKAVSHAIFKQRGIPIPRYAVIHKKDNYDRDTLSTKIDFLPAVIKPATQGSSIGITIVKEKDALENSLKDAFEYDEKVVVEEFISGREMTVGILEDKPLPIIEIAPKKQFFDFEAKYSEGKTDYITQVDLPVDVYKRVQEVGVQAHLALGCRDFSRVDMILRDNTPYVLEVNTIPGFTSTSLLPKAAGTVDIDFTQLCLKLLNLANGKGKEKK